MTSSTDTDEHPEVTEISALTEGLLPPDRTTHVRDHLTACELSLSGFSYGNELFGLTAGLSAPKSHPLVMGLA